MPLIHRTGNKTLANFERKKKVAAGSDAVETKLMDPQFLSSKYLVVNGNWMSPIKILFDSEPLPFMGTIFASTFRCNGSEAFSFRCIHASSV